MSQTLLSVEGVVKEFGRKRAVDCVSFAVRRGEILGFLGPNGAGKTTTIRMIMGITAPDQGRITYHVDGRQENRVPKERVGYLPEERGLYKEARVMDVLLFLAGLKGMDKKTARARSMEWLERFGLKEYAFAKVQQLSKGMAQKVQFIASVIHDPDLVVLDEPFSGLDPVNQDLFKAEIRRLAASGSAVLLSSHQMNLVEELCHSIFLIHHGKRVLYGSLYDIKAEYGAHRVRMLITRNGWTPPPSPLVEADERDGAWYTCLLRPGVAPVDYLRSLPDDAPIEELSLSRISLHDIFVRTAQGGVPG